MITCPEYAEVNSEFPPGSSWDEQTSSMDGLVVAPGATPGNGIVSFELICKTWNSLEFKTAAPGSVDRKSQVASGIRDAIQQELDGNVCRALDIVYSRVSELIRLEWIEQLNNEIESIDPNEIGTDVLLGILTSTLPVRSQLPARSKLYHAAFKILKQRKHFERGILDGLE